MRTRSKGYKDYGLTDARVKEIMEYCRTAEDSIIIEQAAEKANPSLATYLVESLKDKMSYDKLYKKYWVPLCRGDFYAYRRLTISLIDRSLLSKE